MLCLALGVSVRWLTQAAPGEGTLRLVVDPYEGRAELASRLHAEGLIKSPRLFMLYLTLSGEVAPGPHLLARGESPREVHARLARAPRRASVQVTLPEGHNLFQIAERLEARGICPREDFVAAALSRATLHELGISRGQSVEGTLFPATYPLLVDSPCIDVIRRLVREMRRRLAALGESEVARRRGWGEHEVLTLASMIEKEAQVAEERPLISSVFHNRLDSPEFARRRLLQSDPTSAYLCYLAPHEVPACAGFKGLVTPALNRDPKNRYSTYVVEGLPPGPIASPGEASLRAALFPAKSDYLFFVAEGGGRHRFTRTYAEHQRAIQGEPEAP